MIDLDVVAATAHALVVLVVTAAADVTAGVVAVVAPRSGCYCIGMCCGRCLC